MKHSEDYRHKLYGCDGICYWATGMCPRVEICKETRVGERRATVLAIITIITTPIIIALFAIFL